MQDVTDIEKDITEIKKEMSDLEPNTIDSEQDTNSTQKITLCDQVWKAEIRSLALYLPRLEIVTLALATIISAFIYFSWIRFVDINIMLYLAPMYRRLALFLYKRAQVPDNQ
ncbi:hypothetical protein Pmani_032397 [Petrolisthes manimaculis]|uniref:Uncharacterized protein n=1 Tax=Petrolisthes manimaculis TaxID=1843537 RepID=A0AAE1NTP6_9EUCA|nr:hypothetical protein Pmani_032397 [Petrolisthes manimaculis]